MFHFWFFILVSPQAGSMMAHIRLYRLPLCAGQSGIEPTETVFASLYLLAAMLHPLDVSILLHVTLFPWSFVT